MTTSGEHSVTLAIRQGASLGALVLALLSTAANAQDATPADDAAAAADEEITVTASRVARAGFLAPTPTTNISGDELRVAGRTSVGTALADIPQFRPTTTPATTSTLISSGATAADLRGIGEARTLVLVNGRRPVATTARGFNLNAVPFAITERVEVVTGGASAAWGSGAVAGVVNIILDDDLEGLQTSARYGISSRGDAEEYQIDGAYGADFADGRGHILIGAEYVDSKGARPRTSRKNVGGWALFANPDYTPTNGQSQFVVAPNARYSRASTGGLIVSGPLAGTEFGPGGVPEPFEYGSLRGPVIMSGGDGAYIDDYAALVAPYFRGNGYARATYEASDSLRVTTDLLYSKTGSDSDLFPDNNFGNLRISVDNAFLPASVRNQLIAAGQSSFMLGRINSDFATVRSVSRFETVQATFGIDGKLGGGWSWDAYYSYGDTQGFNQIGNQRISSLFAESLDSVISPTTGQPICRSALTNPTTACVPVNIFGSGSPSAAARAYFTGDASFSSKITLHVAAANLRGEPFSTWAGPVSLAIGAEWREEEIATTTDALSQARRFSSFNASELDGGFNVKEAFAETVVPLAQGLPFAEELELNAAIRISDYSTSGSITSWKVGATNEVGGGLKLRATRSRDIRAPNLSELYTVATFIDGIINDPVTNRQAFVRTFGGGNPDLDPETADTITAGLIYRPTWQPRLNLAVDYYAIEVEGAIAAISGQQIVDRCFAGNDALCDRVTRDSSGAISSISSPFINLSTYEISGVDIELAYNLPLTSLALPGNLNLRLLTSYVDKLIVDDGVTRANFLRELGPGGPGAFGVPRWRSTLAATYSGDVWSVNARARYVGGGVVSKTVDIANNEIKSRTYFDLGAEVSPGGKDAGFTLFANVRNLFDRDPPPYANAVHYDTIGRYFTFGVRAAF